MNSSVINFDLNTINPELQVSKEMSKYYQKMDTRELVEQILELGLFELVSISVKKARKGSTANNGRGIHIVKLRALKAVELGGELLKPEIVIMNSYDGTSQLKVYVGIYRLICENGLVIATKEFGQFSVRHMGTPAEAAFEVAMGFLDNLKVAVDKQKEMAAITLSESQIESFTRQAISLRWDTVTATADISNVVEVHRTGDNLNSLWNVFNVVQENLTLGQKLEGMKRKGRKLSSAVADTLFNQRLFELALSYATVQDAEFEVLN